MRVTDRSPTPSVTPTGTMNCSLRPLTPRSFTARIRTMKLPDAIPPWLKLRTPALSGTMIVWPVAWTNAMISNRVTGGPVYDQLIVTVFPCTSGRLSTGMLGGPSVGAGGVGPGGGGVGPGGGDVGPRSTVLENSDGGDTPRKFCAYSPDLKSALIRNA